VSLLSFEAYSVWTNALIFVVAAALIWAAGTALERRADAISERTGLGQAFTGALLLSTATSLPEVATTITAAGLLNNPTLAVNNLLGGVALQTGILAFADYRKPQSGALTSFRPRFVLLLQAVALLVLLQLAIAGATAQGRPTFFSISVWPVAMLAVYLGMLYATFHYRKRPRWKADSAGDLSGKQAAQPGEPDSEDVKQTKLFHTSKTRLWLGFWAIGLIVLVAGWAVAQSADVLAEQTGLGDAFLGATLLALATSLPEVSTTSAASQHGRYSMALSNIFGSNGFDVSLLFLAEVLYRGGTIMEHAGTSVVFIAAIGAIMTSIYLWGMLERRDRTFLSVGWDSAGAVFVYIVGVTTLFFMT
jgi:cation:H+ antiporter